MKFILILFISFQWLTLSAQDSLFLRNNQIEIVKVLTIEKTQITYTLNSNLDSTIYTKNRSEIDRIIFSNREVAKFSIHTDGAQFPIKGSKVFIENNDADLRDLNATANKKFKSWGYWNLVPNAQEADYILVIEVLYNGFSVISWGKVKLRGMIKSREGNILWISDDFSAESNGLNGFNPKSVALNRLIYYGIEPNYNIDH
jgi:hypothetical protein